VIGDTAIVTGEEAVSRGRLLKVLALACGIASVVLAFYCGGSGYYSAATRPDPAMQPPTRKRWFARNGRSGDFRWRDLHACHVAGGRPVAVIEDAV